MRARVDVAFNAKAHLYSKGLARGHWRAACLLDEERFDRPEQLAILVLGRRGRHHGRLGALALV